MSLSRKGSGPLGAGLGPASPAEELASEPILYALHCEAAAGGLSAMTINLSEQALNALQEAALDSSESDCVGFIRFVGPINNSLEIGSSTFTFKATDEKGRITELYAEDGPALKKVCDITSKLVVNRVLDKHETEKIKQTSIQRTQEFRNKHRPIQAPDHLENELNRTAKRVKPSAPAPSASSSSLPGLITSSSNPSPSARTRGTAPAPSPPLPLPSAPGPAAPAAESPSGGSIKERIVAVLRAHPKGCTKAQISAVLGVPPARLTPLTQVADTVGQGLYVLKGSAAPAPAASSPSSSAELASTGADADMSSGLSGLTPRAHEVKHRAHELAAAPPPTTRSAATDGAAGGSATVGTGSGGGSTASAEARRRADLLEGLDLSVWNKDGEPSTYGAIASRSQYDRYKDEYKRKYALYRELDRRLQANSAEFDELGTQIKAAKDKDEKKRLKALVQDLFNARNPAVQQMLQMYKVLHVDLSALRERVDKYVSSYRASNGSLSS